jgi:hypothetical protein
VVGTPKKGRAILSTVVSTGGDYKKLTKSNFVHKFCISNIQKPIIQEDRLNFFLPFLASKEQQRQQQTYTR